MLGVAVAQKAGADGARHPRAAGDGGGGEPSQPSVCLFPVRSTSSVPTVLRDHHSRGGALSTHGTLSLRLGEWSCSSVLDSASSSAYTNGGALLIHGIGFEKQKQVTRQ